VVEFISTRYPGEDELCRYQDARWRHRILESGAAPDPEPGIPFRLVEMLDGVAQHRPWHRCRVGIEKVHQSLAIDVPRGAQSAAHCLVDQIFLILRQQFGDGEGVDYLTLPDEIRGAAM